MTDKPIIAPNAYNTVDGSGGILDPHYAGTFCKHHVYIPGPAYRTGIEDGSFAPFCTVCQSIKGIEVSNV